MDIEAVRGFVAASPHELLPPRRRDGDVPVGEVVDLLPIGPASALAVVASGDGFLVVPLVGSGTAVRRATPGDGAWAGVLAVLASGDARGRFAVRRDGPTEVGGPERAIDVDQSNDSLVVGDAAVVKLFVRTSAGPQPSMDLPAHLAAVGFAETPGSIGALVWDGDVLLATAAAYLPGARDGWEWYPELVLDALDGLAPIAPAVDAATDIGGLVGRLHRALATPSAVLAAPVGSTDASRWLGPARATLAAAVALTPAEAGARLRALAADVLDALAPLGAVGETPVMRIHGDLHVGQILRWEGGDAVSDLDGNPMAPIDGRVAPDGAARDVAAMARAIDHVGRVV
ncbi:MAG TPA: phosphotransferase, partial [Actinomycetota bacterium]|nr:phosphotransferase [Actinomycetota bacterium]